MLQFSLQFTNGSLIKSFIFLLEQENKYFENDEQTTIKILNLKIDPVIKQQYIKFNQTPLKTFYKIIDDDLRDAYFREIIQRKFPNL